VRFLILSDDETQLEAVRTRFANRFADGAALIAVNSALYALTECEQSLPTLIISGKKLSDMSGLEFYNLVREDSSFAHIPFILLDSEQQGQAGFMPIDEVLETSAHPADILRVTFKLMTQSGAFTENRTLNREEQRRFKPSGTVKAEGTLEVLTLFDLTLSLSQGKQSGKLYVLLGDTESTILFADGQLVGAGVESLNGEAAVLRIFKLAQANPNAEFYFEASAQAVHASFHTIDMPVNELLLKVAVGLDHEVAPAG